MNFTATEILKSFKEPSAFPADVRGQPADNNRKSHSFIAVKPNSEEIRNSPCRIVQKRNPDKTRKAEIDIVVLFQRADAEWVRTKNSRDSKEQNDALCCNASFGKAKVKLTQTPRAVTPFGGRASFIVF